MKYDLSYIIIIISFIIIFKKRGQLIARLLSQSLAVQGNA